MADPTIIAVRGYDLGAFMKNTGSGSEIWLDRVQRFEPTTQFRTQKYYEIGRKGPTGVTQDPAEHRVIVEKLLDDCSVEYNMAGLNPTPAGSQQTNLGAFLGQDVTFDLIGRDPTGAVDREILVTKNRLTEVQYQFSIRDAIKETWNFLGTVAQWNTSGFTHGTWGTLNNTAPGGVHGKEAEIWFASAGSTPANRAFRLQSFNIRAQFPADPVRELGRRSIVGIVTDAPDVTFDFDLLVADYQPVDKLFAAISGGYDLNSPSAVFDTYIRVFDPASPEATNVIKMFKIDKCRVTQSMPTRAQVRGVATMRYSMTATAENVANNGTLTVGNKNDVA